MVRTRARGRGGSLLVRGLARDQRLRQRDRRVQVNARQLGREPSRDEPRQPAGPRRAAALPPRCPRACSGAASGPAPATARVVREPHRAGGSASPDPPTRSRTALPARAVGAVRLELLGCCTTSWNQWSVRTVRFTRCPARTRSERVVELLEECLLRVGRVARVAAAQPHAAVRNGVEEPVLPRLRGEPRPAAHRDEPHAVALDRDHRRGKPVLVGIDHRDRAGTGRDWADGDDPVRRCDLGRDRLARQY